MESGYAKVDKVIGGGPADKSGLINRNDRIASIGQGTNGEMVSVDGLTLGEVIGSISGPVGSTVRLEILPASNRSNDTRTRVVELRRGVIE
jgi:carboxyl-terminal processing protease